MRLIGLVLALALAPLVAEAQPAEKLARIGYLSLGSAADTPKALLQGLRELGYVEGQNLVIEYRYTEGKAERLPDLAEELVSLKVDIIVAGGTPLPLAAKRATTTIPIVMTSAGDPVGSGLVASLAKPGGNVTGLSTFTRDLAAKRLQLLKEVVPVISRVAVLWNAANPYAVLNMRETEAAARTLGLQVRAGDQCEDGEGAQADDSAVGAAAGRPGHRVGVLDQRGQLLRAAVGFAGCALPLYDRALRALRAWLDSWSGIGRPRRGRHGAPGLRSPAHAVRPSGAGARRSTRPGWSTRRPARRAPHGSARRGTRRSGRRGRRWGRPAMAWQTTDR